MVNNQDSDVVQSQLKLVILGESAVGKTSFLHQFINNTFVDKREPTVGAGFLTKTVDSGDRQIKFNVWDTAGQERFHSLAPMYYRGAQAAIVMYDVTKEDTFGRAKMWVRELQRQAPANIVIALVGNKVDLCNGQQENDNDTAERQTQTEDAARYAAECALLFFETSAKANINVEAVFTEIARNVPLEQLAPIRPPGSNKRSSGRNDHDRVDLTQGSSNVVSTRNNNGCAC
ncbi:ras family protein [Hesseltinella vesiculosa]|uniref:Ras family protein n=1 Tax=Hesseltinella vesiculosa TaxID=101127 RepID=A0A1X2G7Z4_9FUNG|nr:ras family protein [Hesseltinella vesiculosa]